MCGGSSAEEVIAHETQLTLEYMREWMTKHGEDAWNSIRGGKFTALQMGKPYDLGSGRDIGSFMSTAP